MNQNSINIYLDEKADFLFPNKEFSRTELEAALLTVPEEMIYELNDIHFINPSLMVVISVLGGALGLDRFLLKETVTGILKLITAGGFGFWVFIDIFTAKKRCRSYNCNMLLDAINDPSKIGNGLNLDIDMNRVANVAKAAAPGIKAIRKSAKEFSDTLDSENMYYYR